MEGGYTPVLGVKILIFTIGRKTTLLVRFKGRHGGGRNPHRGTVSARNLSPKQFLIVRQVLAYTPRTPTTAKQLPISVNKRCARDNLWTEVNLGTWQTVCDV